MADTPVEAPVEFDHIEKALAAAQRTFPVLGKNAANDHFGSTYTDWTHVVEVVFPILHAHGITVRQSPVGLVVGQEHLSALKTSLIHAESGTRIEESMFLVGCDNPQKQGSAITYAKRYALLAMLGIATKDEDDDGNAASTPAKAKKAAPPKDASAPKSDKPDGLTEAQFNTLMKVEQERDFPEGFGQFVYDVIQTEAAIGDWTKAQASAVIGAAMKRKKLSS